MLWKKHLSYSNMLELCKFYILWRAPCFNFVEAKKNLILHLWLQSSAPKLHMEFTGGLLITNGETINRYFKLVWDLLHICMYNYVYIYILRLPTYAKLLPFQELLLAAFFLPPNRFCMFLMLHMFAGFETAKKPNETSKKPYETAKKIKSLKCGNWSGEKNWKRRTFRQPAIIIAVSDFER